VLVLIFHGSPDAEHNKQAAMLAKAVGAGYAFLEAEPMFTGGLGMPVFVADGADYRKALSIAAVKAPPLVKWPGFREFLLSLGAQLYIFHGPDRGDVGALGLPVAFLEGEPNIRDAPCVNVAAPVVLTRGYIYKKIESLYARCGARLLPPLAEQRQFLLYFKSVLPIVLEKWGPSKSVT